MPATDTTEKGLETLIMVHMTGVDGLASAPEGAAAETPDAVAAAKAGGSGWFAGRPRDYDRQYALDVPQLFRSLADEDAAIGPIPVEGGGHKREPELDRLSNILKAFNEQFGTLFTDADRVARRIKEDIAPKVAADPAYQNAKKNTPNAARIEHDKALAKVMLTLLKDDTQVYKQFVENESFKRFVADMVYALTSEEAKS